MVTGKGIAAGLSMITVGTVTVTGIMIGSAIMTATTGTKGQSSRV
jgi:hypothetical protein